MRVPEVMCGGTVVLVPFDSIAGLYELAAVWPLVTGSVSTTGSFTASSNLWAYGGVCYLNSGGTGYLQYMGGASYYLGSAGYIWHQGNINPVISMRTVYAGDWSPGWGGGLEEPYGGNAFVSGVTGNSGYTAARYRYIQYQVSSGAWYNLNVA